MTPEFYLSLLTLHGTLMVFFVLTLAPAERLRKSGAARATRRRRHGLSAPELLSFWITAVSFAC